MLPFARALGVAGHDVVVACPPDVAAVFDGAPVRVEPVLPSMTTAVEHVRPVLATLGDPSSMTSAELTTALLPTLFGGPQVTGSARALLELCDRDGKPDLVLRDGGETAGLLVAEHLGVPCVAAPSGAANVLTPDLLGDVLTARREELGFAVPDVPGELHPWGRLDCMPAEFSLAGPGVAAARGYRQDDQVARGERLPAWIAELPAGRPLVLAALGTAMPMMAERAAAGDAPRAAPVDPHRALRTVAEAVSGLDAEVVLATGGVELGDLSLPGHVHATPWVPQPLLLQCADLFLTHGGYNGVREAVRHGVPLAVRPLFGDQEHNAARVAELGIGVHCPADAEPAAVTDACAGLLGPDGAAVRARVRGAQRAMLALPAVDAAVADLEELASGRRTTLAP
ncbi:glycosyltransferase [Pseudonocardia sp. HH130630-07]|uniref:glycosyltransferase n=1 Tax=Pseudonocardia sp. HH130630-07 TaxID=1690815 RepID=UPI001E56323B|nr:glycosyltransferase [Pseudonocardia sp. HH130630-07]